MSFVCGAERPEDLARIPGTQWLVASGFANGSGIKLVDIEAHTLRRWYTGEPAQIAQDAARYPDCAAPPDAALMNAQGMSLRTVGERSHLLYVANHGGREAIEIFRIGDAHAADGRVEQGRVADGAVEEGRVSEVATRDEPSLHWIGCVPMPGGMAANSVATFADGTILATVLNRPGTQIADYVQGRITGLVYEWKPGTHAFQHVRGGDLPGNNGLETSPDGNEFYVVAFGWRAIVAFSHTNPTRILRKAFAPGFMPDNIHWDGERLIAAGMQYDEPACGGLRKIIDGKADPMLCHRGYTVAHLNPKSMAWSLVAYSEPNSAFNGASTGTIVGSNLWIGSFQSDRIAIRALPTATDVRP